MGRKERILSVLKGLAMAVEGFLVVTGWALLVLGAVFLWNGCRRKKVSEPKEMVLTACPYCGASVKGREKNCQICGENMYVMKNKE